MTGDTRQRAYSWGRVTFVVMALLLVGFQVNWSASLDNNMRWLRTARAIQGRREIASNPVLYGDKNVIATYDRINGDVSDSLFLDQISALALLDRRRQSEMNWKDAPANPRGLIHLWSALRLCDQAYQNGTSYRGICESNISEIGNALLNHPLLSELHQWDCRQTMDWLVLGKEVNNPQQHIYWQERLKSQCPDHYSAYVVQDSNGQIQMALAYARLGMYDRAIAMGESLLEDSEWSWGHFIVAGFYSAIDALPEAEDHLLAAIAKGEGEEYVSQYYLALAELYRHQDRVQDASYYFCLVLNSKLDSSYARSLKALAESSLEELSGSERGKMTGLCAQP